MEKAKVVPAHEPIAAKPLKLKKILWTTDFSPASKASLPHAIALARRYESRFYLAHVVVPHPYPLVSPEATPYIEGLAREPKRGCQSLPNPKGSTRSTMRFFWPTGKWPRN